MANVTNFFINKILRVMLKKNSSCLSFLFVENMLLISVEIVNERAIHNWEHSRSK